MTIDLDKRWDNREQRWVAPGVLFNPDGFAVDVLDGDTTAKRFICQHHYSGSFPASYINIGLFRSTGTGSRLVGVATFSVPINGRCVPKYTGLPFENGGDLGRFVCLPEVRYNGETWFLARAWECLRAEKPQLRAIISYADPLLRTDGHIVVKPEHYGTIYQASNALYVGRATARTLIFAPNGSIVSERAISKIRGEERGWVYCMRNLLEAGAPERQVGEDLQTWVRRALHSPGFTRVRHPGNHTYVFGLDRTMKKQLIQLHDGGQAYPKKLAA